MLHDDHLLFDYQESLLYCTESARLYNQIGSVDKSISILDWGAALFSYSKEIIGAVAQGAIQGVGDLLQDPLQLGLTIAAPEYMAVYQLARALSTVAGISLRALTDWQQTKQDVQNWIDPLIDTLDQVANGNVSVADVVQTGTRFAVGMQAQRLFCSGMKGFCSQLTNNISDQHRAQMQKLVDTVHRYYQKKSQGCVVFSPEAIEKGVQYVIQDKTKVNHIFKKSIHELAVVQEKLNIDIIIRETIQKLSGIVYENEIFELMVDVANYKMCIRGRVMEGVPKIGTMFIPWDKK